MRVEVDGRELRVEDVVAVALGAAEVALGSDAERRIEAGRRTLESVVQRGRITYGVNTGFGEFRTTVIAPDKVLELQRNLIRSSACAVGEPLPEEVVRAMMLLRANALATGRSGVRLEMVGLLLQMLNRRVHPVVPRQGSVGSSGDLAPLAHIGLVMIGEGEAFFQGRRVPGNEALNAAELAPTVLQAKEGLAMINGTQMMTAIGALSLHRAMRALDAAEVAVTMSLEALKGTARSFDPRVLQARPHFGAVTVAANLRALLEGSEILKSHANVPHEVQDAYTLRCAPQVLGACLDAFLQAKRVLEVEMNSSVDNPLVFEDGDVISGGNFHGMPVAMALEQATLAAHVIGSFSERRVARLVDGKLSHLPHFLTSSKGLESGMMIPQYTAASLVSESKVKCFPACADSIPTSANQEDFNSMGSVSALKLMDVVENTERVVAIELLCACQGLEFAKFLPGRGVQAAREVVRSRVPALEEDRSMSQDIEALRSMVRDASLVMAVEKVCRFKRC
ncbi:MAG TPA: histidine ammonia-lyase [Methanomassiliicoccales archaeon]|nr:histidine ammonia-lyase [Methanomassiliicoccales archaeon]